MKNTILFLLAIIGINFSLKAQDQNVNGNLTVRGTVKWGATGAVLQTDQGASIELRGDGVPYFDFSNDATTDYDMRLILENDNALRVAGGDLFLSEGLKSSKGLNWGATGAVLQTDQGASIELRGDGVPYFDFSNDATTDYDMRLILANDNTLLVSGGDLAVNGKINTKEVEVKVNVWPDYVFEPGYKLPALTEVERHIKKKGHLKGMPNAEEVEKNGISLGEMNVRLLQQIEELMLYTIQQQKQLETQAKAMALLKNEMQHLKSKK